MISHCAARTLDRLSRIPPDRHDAEIAQLPEICGHDDCTTGMGCRAYIATLAGSAFEKRRRECEARDWLRRGYTNQARVNELVALIESKRGREAATVLVDDMREQWKRRAEWLGAAP